MRVCERERTSEKDSQKYTQQESVCFCETDIRDSTKRQRSRQKQNEGGRAWARAKENGRLRERSVEERVGKEADGGKKKKMRNRKRKRERERLHTRQSKRARARESD